MVIFGIAALVAVGLSWTMTGIVMGDAPKKKIDTALIMMAGAVISIAVSMGILAVKGGSVCETRIMLLAGANYFTVAVLNFIMLQLMSKAMQRGPNGIIWSVIQSALIFPFLVGVVFFGSKFTLVRGAGVLCILGALAAMTTGKDNTVKGGGWKLLTLAAFLITGVLISLNTLPSYFPAARQMSSIARTLCTAMGYLTISLIWNLPNLRRRGVQDIVFCLKNKFFWLYVLMLNSFSMIASYFLLYPGMDALAKSGIGAAAYPLMIGSCIVGFNFYSLLVLKEKFTKMQILGVVLCIAGEILLV